MRERGAVRLSGKATPAANETPAGRAATTTSAVGAQGAMAAQPFGADGERQGDLPGCWRSWPLERVCESPLIPMSAMSDVTATAAADGSAHA